MRTSIPFIFVVVSISSARSAEVVVEDIFGRRLNERGLILVDWEGPIANPAIRFFIVPPRDAAFPAKAVLTSKEPRVYFNLPSEIGANGPCKVLEFKRREKLSLLASIFSDWEGADRDLILQLDFEDALGRKQVLKLPCHVVDQDKKDQTAYPVTVDFSQDRTGFFKDEKKRQVVVRAAEDWAYFFEPAPLDPVAGGLLVARDPHSGWAHEHP